MMAELFLQQPACLASICKDRKLERVWWGERTAAGLVEPQTTGTVLEFGSRTAWPCILKAHATWSYVREGVRVPEPRPFKLTY